MDYHERLKRLGLYSLERRRDWFLIINAWQQLEGIKENVLNLIFGKQERQRCIKSALIITILDNKYRTIIQHSTARQMGRLFNSIPYELQNIKDVKTDLFKEHLNKWLRGIPDMPKIDNYRAMIGTETNSITKKRKTGGDPNCVVDLSTRVETKSQ